jgi:beta-N-acetylhexosaminidase
VREAARRVAEAAVPLSAGGGPPERGVGLEAARRALLVDGDVRLPGPALVAELRPEPLLAAGPAPVGLGDVLRARIPETEVIVLEHPAELAHDGRALVLVVRDAHRYPWQRDVVDAALAAGEAIVVETGIPRWRPAAARGYVATHGGGRVNLEAAVDVLSP